VTESQSPKKSATTFFTKSVTRIKLYFSLNELHFFEEVQTSYKKLQLEKPVVAFFRVTAQSPET
jgi:hypothetical protein